MIVEHVELFLRHTAVAPHRDGRVSQPAQSTALRLLRGRGVLDNLAKVPGQLVAERRERDILGREALWLVRRPANKGRVVHVGPLGVVILELALQAHGRHKVPRLGERLEAKGALEGRALVGEGPAARREEGREEGREGRRVGALGEGRRLGRHGCWWCCECADGVAWHEAGVRSCGAREEHGGLWVS